MFLDKFFSLKFQKQEQIYFFGQAFSVFLYLFVTPNNYVDTTTLASVFQFYSSCNDTVHVSAHYGPWSILGTEVRFRDILGFVNCGLSHLIPLQIVRYSSNREWGWERLKHFLSSGRIMAVNYPEFMDKNTEQGLQTPLRLITASFCQ